MTLIIISAINADVVIFVINESVILMTLNYTIQHGLLLRVREKDSAPHI